MKLISSARQASAAMIRSPSFSRSSSSIKMTILPARMSSTSSSTVFSFIRPSRARCSGLQKAVFGEKCHADAATGTGFGGLVTQQQALQVAGNHVHLEVHPGTGLIVTHDGFLQGVRQIGRAHV